MMQKADHHLDSLIEDELPLSPVVFARKQSLVNSPDEKFLQEFCDLIRREVDNMVDADDPEIISNIQFQQRIDLYTIGSKVERPR
jgi:hypothetical protein